MSQSPVARQVLSQNAQQPPKVPARKPPKRISIRSQNTPRIASQVAEEADNAEEEPELLMTPIPSSPCPEFEPLPLPKEEPSRDGIAEESTVADSSAQIAVADASQPTIAIPVDPSQSPNSSQNMMGTAPNSSQSMGVVAMAVAMAEQLAKNNSESDTGLSRSTSLRKKPAKQESSPLSILNSLPSPMSEAIKKESSAANDRQLNAKQKPLPSATALAAQIGASVSAQLQPVTSLLSRSPLLSEALRKDLYPSDDDEDFDHYLLLSSGTTTGNGVNSNRAQVDLNYNGVLSTVKEESLKFEQFVQNPLYNPNAPPAPPSQLTKLKKDDIIRLNEIARRAREQGDKDFKNYRKIERLDKELISELKGKIATRRLTGLSNMRRSMAIGGNVVSLLNASARMSIKEIREELEENRRGSDASVNDEPASSKFDCRTCSLPWRTQITLLKEAKSGQDGDKRAVAHQYTSHASQTREGYIPEWKYNMYCNRTVTAANRKSTTKVS